jgi:hypothetical protein
MAKRLMGGLSPYKQTLLMGGRGGEHRREDDYRQEVREYVDKVRHAVPGVLRARALLHEVARLKLAIVNNTDTTFTGVRVEAFLPLDLAVTEWPRAVRDQGDPPDPPTLYGQASRSSLGMYGTLRVPSIVSRVGPLAHFNTPDVVRREDGVYVEYTPVDVRAQGVTPLPSVWLRIEDLSLETVPVRWEATATNADKRLSGSLSVPITPPPITAAELMEDIPEDD